MVSKQPQKKKTSPTAAGKQRARKYLRSEMTDPDPRETRYHQSGRPSQGGSGLRRGHLTKAGTPESDVITRKLASKREKILAAPLRKRPTEVLSLQVPRGKSKQAQIAKRMSPEKAEYERRTGTLADYAKGTSDKAYIKTGHKYVGMPGERGRLKLRMDMLTAPSKGFSAEGYREVHKAYQGKAAPEIQAKRRRKVQARAASPRTQFRRTEAKKYGTRKR
jgi:hypothetical protein